MTSRERLLAVLHGELPDCVPVDPDISNMVPCRLTGKPFWEIYLYQNPPLWKAHIDAAKHFDLDAGIEVYSIGVEFGEQAPSPWEERIVARHTDDAPVTQLFNTTTGDWHPRVTVYWRGAPPAGGIDPAVIGLPAVPSAWEPVTGVKQWPTGLDLYDLVVEEMGDQGIVGISSGCYTTHLSNEEQIYAYYDDPRPFRENSARMLARVERRMEHIAAMKRRPDLLFCGSSGTLIWQTPAIVRELALPVLKRATELAWDLGIPTHVHSCGPETELVKMAALETKLTIIDPLEIPPMGDCDLTELKRLYGDQIVLKGNLHTTTTMLRGSADEVARASRNAIDAAAKGGGFVLSTGDQCGRDTPDANLHAMVETARTYGAYARWV